MLTGASTAMAISVSVSGDRARATVSRIRSAQDVIDSQTTQDTGAPHADAESIAASLAEIFGRDVGPVRIVGSDPLTPSVHRLGDASAAAIAAFGQQIAALEGKAPVTVHADAAIDQLRASFLTTINPGTVTLEYHCWGADGPWAARGGFDQLACSATGFALGETVEGRPSLPPTYLLNDYLAAYLGAAGTVAALRRRAVEGGSWRVRVELARVCTWVQDLGSFAPELVRSLPRRAPHRSPSTPCAARSAPSTNQ